MNIAEPKVKAAYSLGLCSRQGQVITHGFICLSVTHGLSSHVAVQRKSVWQLALREQDGFELSA